jgi:urocanate hydratase
MDGARPVRAHRGTTLTARSWQTEAPLRMLQNNLDPEVAERPGRPRRLRRDRPRGARLGQLRRDGPHAHHAARRRDDARAVRPAVGVLQTHEWAPRVLIANSNLVDDWATWPEFRRLERLGLTMYGQMTAGSWIYIGTQGILQGTYETFAAVAAKRFDGTLAGTLTLTGGCGGMGGAQPLAVTLNGGVCLVVDVDGARLRRRVEHRYLDEVADDLDDAVRAAWRPSATGARVSVGLVGNCASVVPELLRRGVEVDVVTDQTSAHDPLSYLPEGVDVADWRDLAAAEARGVHRPGPRVDGPHVEAMVGFLDAGARSSTTATRSATRPGTAAATARSTSPGFVPGRTSAAVLRGRGPFRWARSRRPADIAAHRPGGPRAVPDDDRLQPVDPRRAGQVAFQGLPARICWLGLGERDAPGLRFNDMVASGELSPRRHRPRPPRLRLVASPYRETESMADGSDAIADWPLLNALVNTASGATWVSIHSGGGVGIGRSLHAGQVSVADGTPLAAAKLARVLTNDPGTGVLRHVDAGYDRAEQVAAERSVRVPMREDGRR